MIIVIETKLNYILCGFPKIIVLKVYSTNKLNLSLRIFGGFIIVTPAPL